MSPLPAERVPVIHHVVPRPGHAHALLLELAVQPRLLHEHENLLAVAHGHFIAGPHARLRQSGRNEVDREQEREDHNRSTIIAAASPPPMQIATMPRFTFRLSIAWISVTRMREPLEPIGWPSATAPPKTFIFS